MNTNHPDRFQATHRTATIHPITSHPSGPSSTPTRPDEGDADNTGPVSSATERLVLTVDEAAYLLSISRGLAYELVARGQLPAIRLGRRIVIPRVVLEELLGTAIL
ncbi:MAG: helix-turn-helix domain-containing protein [Acidimicrobiales bacterium]|jgi:excisionase family DNA binding protein